MDTAPMPESEQPPEGAAEEPTEYYDPKNPLTYPGTQDAIRQIPGLIKASTDAKIAATRRTTTSALFWLGILTLAILGAVTTLTWFDKLSSDAAAFLFGAIIGAAFTFIRNLLAPG